MIRTLWLRGHRMRLESDVCSAEWRQSWNIVHWIYWSCKICVKKAPSGSLQIRQRPEWRWFTGFKRRHELWVLSRMRRWLPHAGEFHCKPKSGPFKAEIQVFYYKPHFPVPNWWPASICLVEHFCRKYQSFINADLKTQSLVTAWDIAESLSQPYFCVIEFCSFSLSVWSA